MLQGIENHRSKLIWNLTNKNENIQAGLDLIYNGESNEQVISRSVAEGWNFVSKSVNVSSSLVSSVFPDATSGTLYELRNGELYKT